MLYSKKLYRKYKASHEVEMEVAIVLIIYYTHILKDFSFPK